MTNKKQIALFFGGRGYEHSVSVSGAKNLLSLIDRERYGVYTVFIEKSGKMRLTTPDLEVGEAVFPILDEGRGALLTESGERLQIDCAFPLLHGDFGEDGSVQGLLASCSLPFVGSDTRASAICLDKAATKALAEALGIPTVPWRLLTGGEDYTDLELPLFIKPTGLGSSVGASPAHSREELIAAIRSAATLGGGRVLAERLISPIRELECAYFSAQGEEIVSYPGEILCDGFYSYERKYSAEAAGTSSRADVSRELAERMREHTRRLCQTIGVRHLARVDFFLSGEALYLNEINTMPGMTASSLYPRLLLGAGISPAEAINRMISDAIAEGAL